MSDYDNGITLYDEDGNEIEFEILHSCDYQGETYYVLWGEDENEKDFYVVAKGDDFEVVHDEEIIEFVQKSFKDGMNDLMDEVDAFAVESDFMQELNSILNGHDPDDTSENPHNSEELVGNQDTDATITPFDAEKYLRQSQEYLFVEANIAYGKADYSRAISSFERSDIEGNDYAATHLGMMHYYGYGCEKDYLTAIDLFKKGAKNGCPLAVAWISECYRLGQGVEKDSERSKNLYDKISADLEKMCECGDAAALYFLGYNYIMGTGVSIDEDKGVRMLTQAYEKGERRAAVQLAECYYKGWGVPVDEHKTVSLLMKNPMPSNKKAQYLLGLCNYYGKGIDKNLDRAFFHFKAAATLGYGRAKDYLGDCYYNGQGARIDYYEAAKWYKDAADNNGIGTAAYSLAFMYLNGEGVSKSERDAMPYFLIAAEKGVAHAQRIISKEYLSGEYFKQDYEAARAWMEKAAQQGDSEAQVMLGRYYVSDFGFNDEKVAFSWFMKAAEQHYAEAEFIVGGCYSNGVGVTESYIKANEWFKKAIEDGDQQSKLNLGTNYLTGKGIEKDTSRGIELLSQAYDAGVRGAAKVLATQYFNGIENYGGQKKYTDPDKAYKYALDAANDMNDGEIQFIIASVLHKTYGRTSDAENFYINAAQNGHEKAKIELSKLYIENGRNYSEAFKMLQELAKGKNGEAQYYLSMCFEHGYGCDKDKREAKRFYQLASSNGYLSNEPPKKKLFGFI